MRHIDNNHRHNLPHPMVVNTIVILIDSDIMNLATGHHALIVSHHMVKNIDGNNKYYNIIEHWNG